ncbi:MAG TPA: DNA-processing protein DprA [Thermoleophilaceae bacterium]|jgi:DNA processing protein
MSACDACLRRSALIGFLAAPIAGLLDGGRRAPELLALPDEDLIEAVGKGWHAEARGRIERFDPNARRLEVEEAGLFAICVHDGAYPASLTDLGDAPVVLYGAGSQARLAELLEEPAVAIVGARRASAYGLEVARELGRGLSAARVTVVSGLALGIDAAAHRGAVDAGCNTIGVLACGAERAYPRTNRAVYDRMVAGGAVVAELPPGTEPRRWTFPARNRIMAGLTRVTVVVEAAERSGSLITARFAEDIGRDVGAVPGRVTTRMAAGSNRLLYEGAHFIRDAADVLDLLFGAGARREPPSPGPRPAPPLDASLRRVLDAIEGGSSVEAAAAGLGLGASEARAALGRLEMLGLVRRDGLGAYERAVAP